MVKYVTVLKLFPARDGCFTLATNNFLLDGEYFHAVC
jgi:hypothetical protein